MGDDFMKHDHNEWTDRFSAYLDGELGSDEHTAVEQHLAECGTCRRILEEVRAVIAGARDLGNIEPPRDLWAGIAATIQAPIAVDAEEATVIALPTAAALPIQSHNVNSRARYAFSGSQLMAASVVLIAVSSVATWAAGPGLGTSVSTEAAGAGVPGAIVMVDDTRFPPPPALADELASLEQGLEQARAVLDPNTVRVLERNLAVIEQAIEDSRLALEQDPGNDFLSEHLEQVYERKLTYLREAARVAEWSS
jgi:anti-sigma factor RsiW